MGDIALYYPNANFPNDAWVKAAALHWPRLGRIRPNNYSGTRDSDVVEHLYEKLDFLVDIRPGRPLHRDPEYLTEPSVEDQVEKLFLDFLQRHSEELITRYGAEALGFTVLERNQAFNKEAFITLPPPLDKIHQSKVAFRLKEHLEEVGLLTTHRKQWRRISDGKIVHTSGMAMHRRLVRVYLAVLADAVARENQMTLVSDKPEFCAAASGWTVEALAQILLADGTTPETEGRMDYSQAFTVLALQTVLPKDLAEIPVERIIEARRRLLPDLMRYREFLDSLASDFIEISAVPDPTVREAKLHNHVESRVAHPIETMERELGRMGLQPIRAVMTMQTLAPPAALGLLAHAVDLPSAVTSAGVAAGCLVGATTSALDQRRRTLADHPTGYLLNLRQELGPSDTVAQIRRAIRRATATGRRSEQSR